MGDFLLGIQREQMAFGSVFFVSRAVARGSETLKRVPQQIWCQKNATFSSCPFWYIYTQSLTRRAGPVYEQFGQDQEGKLPAGGRRSGAGQAARLCAHQLELHWARPRGVSPLWPDGPGLLCSLRP